MIDVLRYWGALLVVVVFSFLPGYAVTGFFRRLSVLERLAISFALSFVLAAGLSPLLSLSPPIVLRLVFLLILFLATVTVLSFGRKSKLGFDQELRFLIGVFIIQLVVKAIVQIGWEYPTPGGDWFVHAFKKPWLFASGDWSAPADRPPLFSLIILAYHGVLGTSSYTFWLTQIITVVVNSAFLAPAFLIAHTIFGRKVAKISLVFMTVNLFLFRETIYPWPKNLATYFVLLMVYFLFIRKERLRFDWAMAGLFAALGYLAHPLAGFFILPCIIVLAYQRGLLSRDTLGYVLFLGILLLPYMTWLFTSHGTIFTSPLSLYPFCVQNSDQVYTQTREEIMAAFWATPWWKVIAIRLYNLLNTLTELFWRHPVWHFYDTFLSALTFPLFVLAFIGIVRGLIRKIASVKVLLLFVGLPFLSLLLFFGWRIAGLAGQGLQPSVVILIILGFNALLEVKDEALRRAAAIGMFGYALLQFVSLSYYIKRWYEATERVRIYADLGESWHHVAGFDLSSFISAHFLMDTPVKLVASLFIAIILVACCLFILETKTSILRQIHHFRINWMASRVSNHD